MRPQAKDAWSPQEPEEAKDPAPRTSRGSVALRHLISDSWSSRLGDRTFLLL